MKTIKSKISLGVIFLFTVILLLSVLGILFINQLAQQSKGTIKDNYASVDYTMYMISSLDYINTSQQKSLDRSKVFDSIEVKNYAESKSIFEKNLKLETKNISEIGEAELVNQLHTAYRDYLNTYEQLKHNAQITESDIFELRESYLSVKNKILDIYKLNISAINDKTNKMQTKADDEIFYMLTVAIFSVFISLSFVYTFPSRIVEPIKELTKKIKSISERNYDQKLEISTNDELEELANAFNVMAERLKLYDAKQIDQ
ncbi:MAG: HAMP domain-containing protein, partial [Bacteroidota bacterium]|nr:HAMP domain-containing protein [Bacteroidota bacterium]